LRTSIHRSNTRSSRQAAHELPAVAPKLLTIADVADRLSTSERHIRRLVFERRIPYRKIGRYVRFHPDDLAEYVASRHVEQERRVVASIEDLRGSALGSGRLRWRVRYRDPSGRQRSRSFARKIDAERFLISVEDSKLRGVYVDPAAGRVAFGEWAERWYATTAALRHSTRTDYRVLLDQQILPRSVESRSPESMP